MASEAPVGVASRAMGSFSPWEIPLSARACSDSASGSAGRAAVPSGARARARPGEHAPVVGRKKGERGKGKGDWQGCPTRHREKRENALVGLMGCGHGLAGLEALGRLPGL
jgi:hypothetical protein